MGNRENIYVTFRKRGGEYVGHAIAGTKPSADDLAKWDETPAKKADNDDASKDKIAEKVGFNHVIHQFLSSMSTYRNMVAAMISVSPVFSAMIANRALGDYVERYGSEVADLSNDDFSVFELPARYFSSVIRRHEQAVAAINGSEHLPEIATIGLISAFDAYLSSLLRTVFTLHNEIILTSDREIKFSDLAGFPSLEAVKDHIIEKEVETIIRQSHHEQFLMMESKFKLALKKDLDVWPEFIELCERRNLLTHTGGRVSQQYIKVCEKHGYNVTQNIGDRLKTDAEYFTKAVRIVSEMGIKLGHVMWRKFSPNEREDADSDLNEACFNLIGIREYELAESILELAVNVFSKKSNDSMRRMMVINLANAKRLKGDKDGANKTLDQFDWSATSIRFQVCVAAVKERMDDLCSLVRACGANGEISAQEYRDWPVFRGARKDAKFKSTFHQVFDEPLVIDQKKLTPAKPPQRAKVLSLVRKRSPDTGETN